MADAFIGTQNFTIERSSSIRSDFVFNASILFTFCHNGSNWLLELELILFSFFLFFFHRKRNNWFDVWQGVLVCFEFSKEVQRESSVKGVSVLGFYLNVWIVNTNFKSFVEFFLISIFGCHFSCVVSFIQLFVDRLSFTPSTNKFFIDICYLKWISKFYSFTFELSYHFL